MNKKDEQTESIWTYIVRISVKPLVFFIIFFGVVSWWNARNAEIHKVTYKEIEDQIDGLTLMGTNKPLATVLRKRDKDARAWLSESFESSQTQEEIVDFYEQMLSDAGWSNFERKEYRVTDSYTSKKNGYLFNLAFTFDANGKTSDTDKVTKYDIYIRGPREGD